MGRKHQNGVKEYEKDVVQSYLGYFLMLLPILQSQILICLSKYWPEIYFYINVPCMYIKIFWKGHVVMPES